MDKIKNYLDESSKIKNTTKINILDISKQKDKKLFNGLIKQAIVSDNTKTILHELYDIRYPNDKIKIEISLEDFIFKILKIKNIITWGNWVFYPWNNKLVHFPPEDIWEEIRTARNKTLVSAEEQSKFWNFNVGVVGLSVGQASLFSIIRSGGSKNIKLADPDTLDPTNLNRVQADLSICGVKKADIAMQYIYELDPYYNVSKFSDGLTKENLEDFFGGKNPIHVVIDAMDNIPLKIALRIEARKRKIPVIMATDVGVGALIDIERYDTEGVKAIFGGRIGEDVEIKTQSDFIKAGLKIISPEYFSLRHSEAMLKIGTDIPTHPQLGVSAAISGAIVSYLVRRLSNGETFPSERTHIDIEKYFDSEIGSEQYKIKYNEIIKEIEQMLNS